MIWYILACSEDPKLEIEATETVVVESSDRLFAPLSDCSDNAPPIVAIHGFLASGDTFDGHASRWAANGHCLDRFFALDWNTFDQEAGLSVLDAYVDAVIQETGVEQVDLIGHSAGAGLTREYVGEVGEGKVRKLAYVGFSPDTSAPDIPMLNLWSSADLAVPGGDVEGIDNVQLTEEDHYQIATSVDSFTAIYEFLYDTPPQTLELLSEDTSELWGNAVYFGENKPVQGSTIEAFRIDPISGQRLNDEPDYRFTTGEYGLWGPLPTSSTDLWEITLLENSSVPVRHFYAPFEHSSRSVRLRAIPDEGLAATILMAVPFEDESTVNMVTFFKQQSVFSGRDSFVIDGEELLTEERAAADDTIIAMFHFDSGSDGRAGDDPVQFGSFPFMAGTDSVWEANEQEHFEVQFNGQSRVLPKWGSGVVLAIY